LKDLKQKPATVVW